MSSLDVALTRQDILISSYLSSERIPATMLINI
jgi:hypothetical protein